MRCLNILPTHLRRSPSSRRLSSSRGSGDFQLTIQSVAPTSHPLLDLLEKGGPMQKDHMIRRRFAVEAPVTDPDDYKDNDDALLGKGRMGGDLVSSIVDRDERKHVPTLDLDVPTALYPSRNGNWHLMIDTPMSWWKYSLLLRVLSFCGVIEKGYSQVSRKRGYSCIRKPLQVNRRKAEDRVRDVWEYDPNSFHNFW